MCRSGNHVTTIPTKRKVGRPTLQLATIKANKAIKPNNLGTHYLTDELGWPGVDGKLLASNILGDGCNVEDGPDDGTTRVPAPWAAKANPLACDP